MPTLPTLAASRPGIVIPPRPLLEIDLDLGRLRLVYEMLEDGRCDVGRVMPARDQSLDECRMAGEGSGVEGGRDRLGQRVGPPGRIAATVGTFSRCRGTPVNRSMKCSLPADPPETSVTALPPRPARTVRPMRCT